MLLFMTNVRSLISIICGTAINKIYTVASETWETKSTLTITLSLSWWILRLWCLGITLLGRVLVWFRLFLPPIRDSTVRCSCTRCRRSMAISNSIGSMSIPMPKSGLSPVLLFWAIGMPLQVLLPLPPFHLLQCVHCVGHREVLLQMEDGRPVESPLVDAARNVVVLSGLPDDPEVMDQQIDDRIGRREFSPQPRDKSVPLINIPLPRRLPGTTAHRELHWLRLHHRVTRRRHRHGL